MISALFNDTIRLFLLKNKLDLVRDINLPNFDEKTAEEEINRFCASQVCFQRAINDREWFMRILWDLEYNLWEKYSKKLKAKRKRK